MLAQDHKIMSKGMLRGIKTLLLVWNGRPLSLLFGSMMNRSHVFRILLPLIWSVGLVNVEPSTAAIPDPVVQSKLTWSSQKAHAGDKPVLAVILDIHEGYHVNPDQPRLEDSFLIPTQLEVTETAPGLVSHGGHFPPPQSVVVGPIDQERQVSGYEGRVVLYLPFVIDHTIELGSKRVKVALTYQTCNRTQCLAPVTVTLETSLEVVDPLVPLSEIPIQRCFQGSTRWWNRTQMKRWYLTGLAWHLPSRPLAGLA